MKKWIHPKDINMLIINTNSTGFFIKTSILQDLKTAFQLDTDIYTKILWSYKKTSILHKQSGIIRFLKKYGIKK